MKRATGSTSSRVPGQQEEAAEELEVVGRALDPGDHLGQPVERQEVGEGAVGLLDRQLQHLAAQRGEHDRHLVLRLRFELEAGRGALAGQRDAEEFEGLADLARAASRRGSRSSLR